MNLTNLVTATAGHVDSSAVLGIWYLLMAGFILVIIGYLWTLTAFYKEICKNHKNRSQSNQNPSSGGVIHKLKSVKMPNDQELSHRRPATWPSCDFPPN
jgi:hypothetical protein